MAELSTKDIAFAATNDPTLADMTVMLGDREFPILYLKYKNQAAFLALLRPLFDSAAGGVIGLDSGMAGAALITHCLDVLPQLAQVVLSQSDPSITVEQIEEMEGVSPFSLATVVLKQLERNRMLEQVVDFFKQVLPLMKMAMKVKASTKK